MSIRYKFSPITNIVLTEPSFYTAEYDVFVESSLKV